MNGCLWGGELVGEKKKDPPGLFSPMGGESGRCRQDTNNIQFRHACRVTFGLYFSQTMAFSLYIQSSTVGTGTAGLV